MKPIQYRNRRPIEYRPHDFRTEFRKYYGRVYIARRRRRKLPGIFVGVVGILFLIAAELIQGEVGVALFGVAAGLIAIGAHFELINRVVYQFKYFVVPAIGVALLLVYVIRPQSFKPILPRQFVTVLAGFSSGFHFNSPDLTVMFGGGDKVAVSYTRRQLEQAGSDSLSGTKIQIPFTAYIDSGKLFIDADVFAGADLPTIRIRRNVIYGLPDGWDGNYSSSALEIMSPDSMPVFQVVFLSDDRIRIDGVFQAQGGLVIADDNGVSYVKGKRILFYGTKQLFKYPSWKYPHQRLQ